MAKSHVATVRKVLREYADRGVFGGFAETPGRRGKVVFEFVWLYNRRYSVEFSESTQTLTFKDFLPHVPRGSALDKRIREFVKSRFDRALRPHRRIDAARAEATCRNRNGSISVSLRTKRNQFTYTTRKLVNLVHEIFLMIDQEFTAYLYDHFDLPEE